jgi:hypothetical protein
MGRIRANYWKVEECKYKLQMRTSVEQEQIEAVLPDWQCVSFGYVPKTEEDIYVFEKSFDSELEWTNFLKSEKVKQLIEVRKATDE